MDENKVFMPPPPKELKNVPPPPPPKPPVLEQTATSVDKHVKEKGFVKEKEEIETTSVSTFEKQESTPLPVAEMDNLDTNQGKVKHANKDGDKGWKTALYWAGFVISLALVGVLIFLLLK